MILFLMQTTVKTSFFDFLSEPLGVLIFAVLLIGSAVGLRRFLNWNEALGQKTQELLEKTIS